jgi:hypothetical protein
MLKLANESEILTEAAAPRSTGYYIIIFSVVAGIVESASGFFGARPGRDSPDLIECIFIVTLCLFGIYIGVRVVLKGNFQVTLYSDRLTISKLGYVVTVSLGDISEIIRPTWFQNEVRPGYCIKTKFGSQYRILGGDPDWEDLVKRISKAAKTPLPK